MLENNAFWVKVELKFVNESVEPTIEFPNVCVSSFANFEVLRVKGGHTFFFTPSVHESSGTSGEQVQENYYKCVRVFFS